jgi:hypothetical protein
MGLFDTLTNFFFGTERVKASKAECKAKKEKAKTDYDVVMKQIEAECEASLTKAKQADRADVPQQPINPPDASNGFFSSKPSEQPQQNRIGGKKGGKSKKRSKSNRNKTARKY